MMTPLGIIFTMVKRKISLQKDRRPLWFGIPPLVLSLSFTFHVMHHNECGLTIWSTPSTMMTTDVEMESMSGSPSGTNHPSLPPQTLPSSTEHAKLALPLDQMSAINDTMCEESDFCNWSILLKNADHNPQAKRKLMSVVLTHLTLILSTKGFNTSGLQCKEVDTIVKGFSEGELEEWEAGLQMGVDMGKWGDLVAHHTYHPILNGQMAFQIFISKVD